MSSTKTDLTPQEIIVWGTINFKIMKRKIMLMLFSLLFFLPIFSNNARADEDEKKIVEEEKQTCVDVVIKCANGDGTHYSGCGTTNEILQDLDAVIEYFVTIRGRL